MKKLVSPTIQKLGIKNSILKVLKRDGSADADVLLSSLRLETGFGKKVICEILYDMENVGWIQKEKDHIILTPKGSEQVAT